MISRSWKKKTLDNGVRQFVHYDEDAEEELMMLPTDLALTADPTFKHWVNVYAQDKEKFFEDFAKVFAKLVELGIQRDENGKVINSDNEKGGYHSAPKKSSSPGKAEEVDSYGEAEPLREENEKRAKDKMPRARL
jgi:cytochrome c peroxidase